ncbi:MAG: GerMN domain-containing protein [Bacillus sp. (in: Bacteria)]|nr:GerMN domain-containing protein [Bacillus sp. (in: firmicutes)]MCM1426893.1 GerMN domain-containing protein [Eubacterium sp.]
MKTKRKLFLPIVLLMLYALTGCGQQAQNTAGKAYNIYYVDNDETKIFAEVYRTETTDGQKLLEELLEELSVKPDKMQYKAPLTQDFELLGCIWEGGQLTLNFDVRYKEMDNIKEILVRAAIVRTLSQIENVNYISFTVQNEPLMDSTGVAVGTMSADTFIDNAGHEINTYEKANLRLYFANENGDMLIEENQRNVVYNSNVSLEKLVVEKLIEGPATAGHYPTINPSTKIVSVTVNDRICYVNLDETFLSQPYNVTSDVTIYSLTNSLVELPNINKVQISINGETAVLYKETVNLTNMFERNLDLVTNAASAAE